jgi:hypothetical protein
MTDRPDDSMSPPGAVSDQNREEGQSGLRDDSTHPEPRTRKPEPDELEDSTRPRGAAGEGSQSTGHPHNAG